jgi:hypothetical protein
MSFESDEEINVQAGIRSPNTLSIIDARIIDETPG